ncbi:MAG: hypothetical protein J6I98_08715, partial [Clostridia bacterium]|nr:hypothetical protein [Clostridia bacterium]
MRQFILGTDWWSDCDDAVALRLLARAAKQGEIRLLGIGINACMQYSAASLRGFLRTEGLDDIPLGLDTAATDFSGIPSFQARLAATYGEGITNADAMDAVRLYRRLLSAAEESVEILEIGFMQVITAVLESPADDISPLTGMELVRQKVKKMWVMAGKWDADGEKEHNFCLNARARTAAEAFCRLCPVPVTFLGWEVGFDVITGGDLTNDDPLHMVLSDHGSANGRSSWDPMLALLAVTGDEAAAGYDTATGFARVDPADGANYFRPDPNGPHRSVIKNRDNAF